ncbi:MAG: RNA polymerase factor sigma-54 [Hyphomicrobiaceae bacterium]
MALSVKLDIRQGQQLVMTPQLQQAIRLLQLSNMELTQYVETELERNPLLERDETSEGRAEGSGEAMPNSDEKSERSAASETSAKEGETALNLDQPVADPTSTLDTAYDNVYSDGPSSGAGLDSGWSNMRTQTRNFSDDENNLEAYVAENLSLKDHLLNQMVLVLTEPAERIIGQYLIDLVDDAGYVPANLEQLAGKLGASEEMIENVIKQMQTFDPPGVFARSLSECLALQLKEQNRYDPQIANLLDNLDLLASHKISALKKAVGVDMDEISEMISEIKTLNPKPGLKFGFVQVQPAIPDVLVRSASDGSWIVELNNDTLPRVLVNRQYYTRVSKSANDEQEKDYLVECLQTANWLAKSLDQRARTILRVAEEIVRQQDGFFTYGVQHLRPLNLKTVADAISMHESTVSRVTSNKYMATPRGIFELKYFFTSAIASATDGEAHSSESVRHRIKQLIDGETAKAVLSDDKIVEKLKLDGIDIARRTVAKYREAMRIPSSVQRRREKKLSDQMASTP